jgi:SAM-dependent methyltransferase
MEDQHFNEIKMNDFLKKCKLKINKFLKNAFGYKIVKVDRAEENRRTWIERMIKNSAGHIRGNVLNVGAGIWTWPKEQFGGQCHMENFDQFKNDNVDIVGDAAHLTSFVKKDHYDAVLCIETMEHVPNPFIIAEQMRLILKPGGMLIASSPFVHDLHGEDYGDYWRITRQGWRELFKEYSDVKIVWLGPELRPLQYFVVATK